MAQPAFLYCTYGITADVTATSTLSGTLPADILIPTEDTFHSPSSTSAYSIVIDAGVEITADYIAILGDVLDGVTVEIRGSTDNFSGSDDQVSAGAALSSDLNAAWRTFGSSSYRYWKLNVSGHSTAIKISHACLDELVVLPYFATDWDEESLLIESSNLVSSSGIFIGVNQQNAMQEMALDIGEITAAELVDVKLWRAACIKESNPFFFVPDTSDETKIFYGWLDEPSFSAPFDGALYAVASMAFITRAD